MRPYLKEERAEEPAMANKPEFVDLIRDATRQRRRTPPPKIIAKPEVKDERRLSNWPPSRFARRLENLLPWKLNLKNWQFKDWL
jgi:hypothetical protein